MAAVPIRDHTLKRFCTECAVLNLAGSGKRSCGIEFQHTIDEARHGMAWSLNGGVSNAVSQRDACSGA